MADKIEEDWDAEGFRATSERLMESTMKSAEEVGRRFGLERSEATTGKDCLQVPTPDFRAIADQCAAALVEAREQMRLADAYEDQLVEFNKEFAEEFNNRASVQAIDAALAAHSAATKETT